MGSQIVVGLGNPGARFDGTRHNVGFEVVDVLAGPNPWVSAEHFAHTTVSIRSRRVTLVKPTTFMNDSGIAVKAVLDLAPVDLASDLLILVDDIHLDVGRIRIRRNGSEGGHNGLRSIVSVLLDDGFARMRLGVGAVPSGVSQIDHVLGRFEGDEVEPALAMRFRAADAVRSWCSGGVEVSMNLFNRNPY